jgi:probable rRNA maturation factor
MDFPLLPPDATDSESSSIDFYAEDVPLPMDDQEAIAQWLMDTADSEEVPLTDLTYIFCSDDYLLRVNQEYLDHDYYTDVITFQLTEGVIHGDVFISTDRIADNAKGLGVSFEHELHRVMVHGLLHLAGYSDKTPEAEATMRAKEDFYLARFGVGR